MVEIPTFDSGEHLDDQLDLEIQTLKSFFKNEKIEYHIIDTGWANRVYVVDNLIFRFNRFEWAKAQAQRERQALLTLSHMGLDAFPMMIAHDSLKHQSFMVYKKIPGTPLSNDVLKNNQDQASFIAQSIACLLMLIHQLPQEKLQCLEFPYGGDHFWRDIWEPVSVKLSPASRMNSKKYFESIFSLLKNAHIPKTIIHGDLGTNNILFNEKTKRISGIIDFGDIAFGDIARDFNGFFRHHGADFVSQVLRYYKIELGDYFWERVEFYAKKQKWMIYFYADKFQHEEVKSELLKSIEAEFSS